VKKSAAKIISGAVGAFLISTACLADTKAGAFNVNISLLTRPGLCLSESLSQSTGAAVHVVCESSQFVSIDPQPGRPFLGVHGGAFRYLFGPGNVLTSNFSGMPDPFIGTGTVTELRIFSAEDPDGPLEILISF
jgi:hypothetical protein